MPEYSEEHKEKIIAYYKKLGINLLILFILFFATFLSFMYDYLAVSLVLSAGLGYMGLRQVNLFTQKNQRLNLETTQAAKKRIKKENKKKEGKRKREK